MSATRPDDGARVVAGRYRLEGLLGSGGAADVHRAHDEVLDRAVALKLLRAPGDDAERRLQSEVRVLARLDSPALVPVFDAGTTHGQPFFVMGLVDGHDLAEHLARGPLPVQEARALGLRLAEGLAVLHAAGVVHRDVKPGNVLLPGGDPAQARLTDLGVARVLAETAVTAAGDVVGTAAYLAPEQVTGERVGPPADVFAAGLVLLECLTGAREYAGTGVEAAVARLHRAPRVPDDLPPRLAHLLGWMVRDQPDARPMAPEVRRRLADPALLGPDPGAPAAAAPTTPAATTRRLVVDEQDGGDDGTTRRLPSAPRTAVEGRPSPASSSGPRGGGLPGGPVAVALVLVVAALVALAVLTSGGGSDLGPLEEPLQELEQEVGLR